MHRYAIIGLIYISFTIAGCMPIIAPSPSPKEPINNHLPEKFKQSDSIYLILPVWDKYPNYYDETSLMKDHKNIAGNPIFINGDEMDRVHEKIPRKVIIGIASIAANMGREIVPKGIMIFSETGFSIYVELCQGLKIFDLRWCKIYDLKIDLEYWDDLTEMIIQRKEDKSLLENVFESALRNNDFIRSNNPYSYNN